MKILSLRQLAWIWFKQQSIYDVADFAQSIGYKIVVVPKDEKR